VPRRFKILSRCEGVAAVELALIFPFLMLLVFGIIDFGHYWYIGHVMSDASREGGRYGTRYVTVGNIRILPGALSPSISTHVLVTCGYASFLPPDSSPDVVPSGAAMTADIFNLPGKDLVVTVTATKTWWVLGHLIPGFGSSKLLTVKTTMTCE
jgi:hypothetical protein